MPFCLQRHRSSSGVWVAPPTFSAATWLNPPIEVEVSFIILRFYLSHPGACICHIFMFVGVQRQRQWREHLELPIQQ
jgi:hypothetical protein